jgi:hexosaminidase
MSLPSIPRPRRAAAVLTALVTAAGCLVWTVPARAAVASMQNVVPIPVSIAPAAGVTYTLPAGAGIFTTAGSTAAADVGVLLAER